jgi:hypothetical protein
VNETTAQDASGSTIAPWADPQVAGVFDAGDTEIRAARLESASGVGSKAPEPCTDEEAVDAAGPVDAQTAPTGPWKTADGFPRAPTAIIGSLTRESQSRNRHGHQPANDNNRVPPVVAATPLLTLRRQK